MKRAFQVFFGLVGVGLVVFVMTREPKRPSYPRWKTQGELIEKSAGDSAKATDVALVKGLLKENLSKRTFDFAVVAEAVSGKKVLPLGGRKSGARVKDAIEGVMGGLMEKMNSVDSPVLGLRRINEGSRFFEDGLMEGLDALKGIRCEIPMTRDGTAQRSGYPDLKITDEATGEVFYLDPKLMEHGSENSTLRTFYFEPKEGTLKIMDDATHLLIGIEHDGKDGEWAFLGWRLVDLSELKVRLKAEFQASNKDVYSAPSGLEAGAVGRKDGDR